MFTRITAATRDILQSEKGVVAIQMALVMTALLGMAGLAIDIGFALDKQRQMQSAADGAAFSAAIAKSTGHPAAFSTEAYAVAGQVGFVNGANGVTVTVNNPPVSPPASGADAANASAIQVIIQQPQTLPLVSTVCSLLPSGSCSGAVVVAAQAVAKLGSGAGCALETLGGSGAGVTISNGATVTLTSCGLVANSTGNPAILVTGGATLNTQSVSSSGFTTTSGAPRSTPPTESKTIRRPCWTPTPAWRCPRSRAVALRYRRWPARPEVPRMVGNQPRITLCPGSGPTV